MFSNNKTRDKNGQGEFPATLSIATLLMRGLSLQSINLQAQGCEGFGSVRHIYDGKLDPETMVNTPTRNYGRLSPRN